ncbi:MAG: hypothetical protein E6713_09730, partial [Sporomusaceae bacterium]|nr:hypothetical protein [Sporomusaceae bacterium]
MKNVYEKIRLFYDKYSDEAVPIRQDWIEGFLRHKAWQGASEKELNHLWRNMMYFLQFMVETRISSIESFGIETYYILLSWLDLVPEFKVSLASIRELFAILTA